MTGLIPEALWQWRPRSANTNVRLSEGGSRCLAYCTGKEGEITVLDRLGNPLYRHEPQGMYVHGVGMSPQGDYLVTVASQGKTGDGPATVCFFDLCSESLSGALEPIATYRVPHRMPLIDRGFSLRVSRMRYSAFAATDRGRSATIYHIFDDGDLFQGRELRSSSAYLFNPDGELVWRRELNVDGDVEQVFVTGDGSFAAAVTRYGHFQVLIGGEDLVVFEFLTRELGAWLGVVRRNYGISVSDDGRYIAAVADLGEEDFDREWCEFALLDTLGNDAWTHKTQSVQQSVIRDWPIQDRYRYSPELSISERGTQITALVPAKGIYRFDPTGLHWKYESKGTLDGRVLPGGRVLVADAGEQERGKQKSRGYHSFYLVLLDERGEVAWKQRVTIPSLEDEKASLCSLSFSADGRYVAGATLSPSNVFFIRGVPVCTKCGELNRSEAKFCRQCGERLWGEITTGEKDRDCKVLKLRV